MQMNHHHDLAGRLLFFVENAHALIGDTALERDRRVHKARLAIKRARTLLRVLRPEIGVAAREIADLLRLAAAALAGARESDALLDLARQAAASAPPGPARSGFAALVARLAAEAEAAHQGMHETEEATAPLVAAKRIAATLRVQRPDEDLLRTSLMRVYRRGRRDWHHVHASELDIEALHDWRKRVKDRLTLARLTAEFGADGPARRRQLDALQELLGLERDLAILIERVAAMADLDLAARAAVTDHLDALRTARLRSALFLGRILYGPAPRHFRRQIGKAPHL
ncbi:MAG: CHAD domain-containing protein [Hyphomicrobiales bacterium]